MTNNYFSANDTLWDISWKYPETIPVFVSQGFKQMEDETKRKAFGCSISLKTALSMKKINIDTFVTTLVERIHQERNLADTSLQTKKNTPVSDDAIRIEGLLPCPVRIPLLERFQEFVGKFKETHNREIVYELKAASMGLDWLKEFIEKIEDPEKLPDIIISAGFDLFFDEKKIGKFKKDNTFIDSTGFENVNLKDPAGHYSMIGVVPAILVVNTTELNGRPVPKSWKDILEPEYEKSVSLPIADFDLFNAILLNIYKQYGEQGVEALGRNLMESMHPSQMVKSGTKKNERPAITVMPYFFTKMIKDTGPMNAIWPEDGAIISPIFMLTKRDKIEQLQEIIDFFASKEVGEIMAHKGLMPSIHPGVDNRIPVERKFMWLGWNYIYKHDIGELIERCKTMFEAGGSK